MWFYKKKMLTAQELSEAMLHRPAYLVVTAWAPLVLLALLVMFMLSRVFLKIKCAS